MMTAPGDGAEVPEGVRTPDAPGASASTSPRDASASTAPSGPSAPTSPRGKGARSTRPAVECRKLTKRYGDTLAVSNLNLSVARGEVFGLLGPNGAGKTTTILMLLGLTEPTKGGVRVLGFDPAKQALEVKRRVGYLPDSVGFYPGLSARQNLRYTARLNGLRAKQAEEKIDSVLDIVGLSTRADDRVGTYSRGMGQRLGIADALIKDPEVLILDEPTVGLDPRGADQILDTITRLARDSGVTVLLSSHLLTQVQAICHRIGIFVSGSLVAAGTIDELAATHGGRVGIEVAVRGGDAYDVLRGVDGVVEVQRQTLADDDGYLVGALTDVRLSLAHALTEAGFAVVHLRRRTEELGSIYRRYFSEADHDAA